MEEIEVETALLEEAKRVSGIQDDREVVAEALRGLMARVRRRKANRDLAGRIGVHDAAAGDHAS